MNREASSTRGLQVPPTLFALADDVIEYPYRSAMENHVHRAPRLGERGLLDVRMQRGCRELFHLHARAHAGVVT
jgi:hypothetical protein